ncbi:MAG TPA: hypothetical protein PKK48_07565 [Phycisphaerae bacterium]|nr:hypothetical protein [Phycisphaerae bacterium]HPS53347.1 hypothetical protein [Phycisphaerae bacterium]
MKSAKVLLAGIGLVTLLISSGCVSRIIKEGVGTATGAKGGYQELDNPGRLAGRNFQLGKFEDVNKRIIPGELLRELPAAMARQMAEDNIPATGAADETVVINGRIIYYEKAGASGQLFGPLEEVVAEVTLVDKASGRILGQAMCVGRSQESVNQGVKEKAQGLAKGICSWIVKAADIQKKKEKEKS